jgi:hypothetical protein
MSRPLSPARYRTFYNAADAWLPPGAEGCDLAPALDARLRAWSPLRRAGLAAGLALLEWQPRLRGQRGFSWLPREERARCLVRWERSRVPPRREAAARLRALMEECLAEA